MKKNTFLIICITLIACFLGIACNNNATENASTDETKMNTATEATAIQVDVTDLATIKDVVCGMSMKNVPISDTIQRNGKVYPFCNKACKEIFQKNVTKYAVN